MADASSRPVAPMSRKRSSAARRLRQAERSAAPVVRPAPAPVDPTRHVVIDGETLASIARRAYGDATRWKELFDANRQVIGSNPAQLVAGMVLHIPRDDG